jgi:hypothetical protein
LGSAQFTGLCLLPFYVFVVNSNEIIGHNIFKKEPGKRGNSLPFYCGLLQRLYYRLLHRLSRQKKNSVSPSFWNSKYVDTTSPIEAFGDEINTRINRHSEVFNRESGFRLHQILWLTESGILHKIDFQTDSPPTL